MPQEAVAVVGVVGPSFVTGRLPDHATLPASAGELTGALRDSLPGVRVAEPVLLIGEKAVVERLTELRAATVIVALPAAGMAQVTLAALAQAGRPVVLLAEPATQLHVVTAGAAALRSAGTPTHLTLTRAEAVAATAAELGHDRLGREVILLVGGTSPSIVDAERDAEVFGARAKVRVIAIGWEQVFARADALAPAVVAGATAAWRAHAASVDVDDTLLRPNVALGEALRELALEHAATAIAADCMASIAARRVSPCLAFSRLEDSGLVVGCEGDLTALWARLILRAVSGRRGFVGNIGPLDLERNTVTLWHHTVPLMLDGRRLPYALRPYGTSNGGYGVHALVTIPTGFPVTLLRLDRTGRQATVAEGSIVDGTPPPGRNHSRVVVQVASARRFAAHLLGNHHALVPGHWAQAVEVLAARRGIAVQCV